MVATVFAVTKYLSMRSVCCDFHVHAGLTDLRNKLFAATSPQDSPASILGRRVAVTILREDCKPSCEFNAYDERSVPLSGSALKLRRPSKASLHPLDTYGRVLDRGVDARTWRAIHLPGWKQQCVRPRSRLGGGYLYSWGTHVCTLGS